jgi:hypothetical protein
MSQLIKHLKQFNSKERFFLVGQILGNPDFVPSPKFRKELGIVLNPLEIPDKVFSAMDYHLDWIYASLKLATDEEASKIYVNSDKVIMGQQEDVDFLIAFDEGNETHIVFLEAKGVTGWTNKQMSSKIRRFIQIFGKDGKKWPGVTPHLVIISPKEPQRLTTEDWEWCAPEGKAKWMELSIPEGQGLKRVTRCNESGKEDINGTFWTVVSR